MGDGDARAADGPRLVMLGPPGSGKGTQAALLAERLGIPAISTGQMLRRAVDGGSRLGREVASVMTSGSLVGDDTMAEVVSERLSRDDAVNGFLLDGYPRTLAQADALAGILEDHGTELDAVVFLDAPEEVLVRRALARQRADDTEEVIRRRHEVYRRETAPLIEYYEGLGLLRRVDGDRTIEEVNAGILQALGVNG